jgi:hypothetical protein
MQHNSHDDPIPGIDRILLEDVMRRHTVELTATARRLQVASLVLVLLGVLSILVRDIAYQGRSGTALASGAEARQTVLAP